MTGNLIVPKLDSQASDIFTCKILIFALTKVFLSAFLPCQDSGLSSRNLPNLHFIFILLQSKTQLCLQWPVGKISLPGHLPKNKGPGDFTMVETLCDRDFLTFFSYFLDDGNLWVFKENENRVQLCLCLSLLHPRPVLFSAPKAVSHFGIPPCNKPMCQLWGDPHVQKKTMLQFFQQLLEGRTASAVCPLRFNWCFNRPIYVFRGVS